MVRREEWRWTWQVPGDGPWSEVALPFEFRSKDEPHYPPATGQLLGWVIEEGRSWFTRGEASRIARRVGLADVQHSEELKRQRGLVFHALEILEIYDYLRTQHHRRFDDRYIVNPALLRPGAQARIDLRRRTFDHDQKRTLWFMAGGRCCICRVRLGPDWHADHVVPWSKGGLTEVSNGAALCRTCNLEKHDRMPEEE